MYNSKLQTAESEKEKASTKTDICQLLVSGIHTLAEAEAETLKLNHELEIHKIELELQNEKLRQAKDQAEVATGKYTELYDYAPSGNFTLSKDGKIIELNLSGSRMFGKERRHLINSSFSFFISDDTKSIFNRFIEKVFISQEIESCEVILSNSNRPSKFVLLTGIVSGNGENCQLTVVDITGREQAEAEMQLKNEELIKINAEKDKFFSIIAHDLRGPFIGFLGMTELMAEGLSDMTMEEIQEMAVVMKSYANNLYRLLGNLLEWSRMQRGLTTLSASSFLLKPKIVESMVLVQEAANKKEIAVNYDIPEDLMVFADGNMLSGIIRNLATNAVKFTPKGGDINISAKTDIYNSVEISVRDTGIGMNTKMLNNLFRLGENVNRNGTEGESSTGLGLILCKDFVEKHGGKLWVESEEGKGSTFYFTFPARNEEID
jgi:PAS domain S-box-containing protein